MGPLHSEAKAFEAGFQFARDTGIQEFVLEGDSLVIVRALCGLSHIPSTVASLILGMKIFCTEFRLVTVSLVRRQGNKPTHLLAKHALSIDDSFVWIDENSCLIEQALIDRKSVV